MIISWTLEGWNEYVYWQKNDKHILNKINKLIKDIVRDPTDGIGEPEKLKYHLTGFWSRRINQEHRLVYKVENNEIIFFQCRHHYQK